MLRILARLLGSRSVVSGAALYVGMRWFDRLIGVISTIVLARLLTPDDFGIVALASIVLGLAVVMLDLGINIAVVQRSGLDREDLDTAWTIRLLQNAIVAIGLSVLAIPAASYYGDPRLAPVLWLLAFAYLLDGFTGMGPVVFQKHQQYAKEVGFYAAKRLFGFLVTMVLAFSLRSYWALVYGTILGNAVGVLLSHVMYRQLPRLTLARWRGFVGASFWLALRTMGGYAAQELDKFVVGRRDGTAVLGGYSIASQIAAMPTSELLAPLSRALFPALAAIKDDESALRRMYVLALGIQCTLALPAAAGLAMVAGDLVPVMLGEKWIEAAPILAALALAFGASALTHSGTYLLMTLGRYRAQSLLQWALAGSLALLVFVIFPRADAIQIAWFRVALSLGSILAITALSLRCLPSVELIDLLAAVRRPVLATLAMVAALAALAGPCASLSVWGALGVKVVTGAAAYAASLLALWRIEGRPQGAERWMLDRLGLVVALVRARHR
jgi:O-antigen/teichoic acid export membrane protein